jgi:hypothetical protein
MKSERVVRNEIERKMVKEFEIKNVQLEKHIEEKKKGSIDSIWQEIAMGTIPFGSILVFLGSLEANYVPFFTPTTIDRLTKVLQSPLFIVGMCSVTAGLISLRIESIRESIEENRKKNEK